MVAPPELPLTPVPCRPWSAARPGPTPATDRVGGCSRRSPLPPAPGLGRGSDLRRTEGRARRDGPAPDPPASGLPGLPHHRPSRRGPAARASRPLPALVTLAMSIAGTRAVTVAACGTKAGGEAGRIVPGVAFRPLSGAVAAPDMTRGHLDRALEVAPWPNQHPCESIRGCKAMLQKGQGTVKSCSGRVVQLIRHLWPLRPAHRGHAAGARAPGTGACPGRSALMRSGSTHRRGRPHTPPIAPT